MAVDTESPGSAPELSPGTLIEAARGDQHLDSVCSSLARMASDERAATIDATAEACGGLRALIDLRRHALAHRAEAGDYGRLEEVLRRALETRFTPATLNFEVVGPDAPDEVLDRLTDCEGVHPIRDRADLLRRLHPTDRRCFALCHPALGHDPIVFVSVALVSGLSPSVQAIIDSDGPSPDVPDADTATFYSINNCQPGLWGIRFGAELLTRAIDHLAATTSVTNFCTLSPIPGFARWLGDRSTDSESALLADCARYLLTAKRGEHPHDRVARFHLGGGARLERLNPGGDTSPRGMRRYRGITANYLYDPDHLDANRAAYQRCEVVAAEAVTALLDEP